MSLNCAMSVKFAANVLLTSETIFVAYMLSEDLPVCFKLLDDPRVELTILSASADTPTEIDLHLAVTHDLSSLRVEFLVKVQNNL